MFHRKRPIWRGFVLLEGNVWFQFLKQTWHSLFWSIHAYICNHCLFTEKRSPVVTVMHDKLIWWVSTEKCPLFSQLSLWIHGIFLVMMSDVFSTLHVSMNGWCHCLMSYLDNISQLPYTPLKLGCTWFVGFTSVNHSRQHAFSSTVAILTQNVQHHVLRTDKNSSLFVICL